MTYKVVPDSTYGFSYSEQRDKPAGVRGVLCKGTEDLPAGAALEGVLCEAESLDEVMTLAKAWRDAHPDQSVYVCDDQHRVVEIVWRTDSSKARVAEARELRTWFGIGLFCVLILNVVIASSLLFFRDRPVLPVVSAVGALELLYVGLVKLKLFNEVEGIHVTVIVSVIVWGVLAFI
jgi:hypothetical protein